MSAIDTLEQWKRAEASCMTAHRASYAKAISGVCSSPEELEKLSRLSKAARESYQRYLAATQECAGTMASVDDAVSKTPARRRRVANVSDSLGAQRE